MSSEERYPKRKDPKENVHDPIHEIDRLPPAAPVRTRAADLQLRGKIERIRVKRKERETPNHHRGANRAVGAPLDPRRGPLPGPDDEDARDRRLVQARKAVGLVRVELRCSYNQGTHWSN